MRLKAGKQIKRICNFYKINFDFHFPFMILLDGNFLKLAIDRKFRLKEKLEKLLKGEVWLYITSCVIKELNLLGTAFEAYL